MLGVAVKKELQSMALHLVAGIIIGYLSFLLGSPLYSVILAVVAAYALRKLAVKLFNEKETGWWFGNGGVIYIFTWLIAWIIFFNL
jgi:hypothetical protein